MYGRSTSNGIYSISTWPQAALIELVSASSKISSIDEPKVAAFGTNWIIHTESILYPSRHYSVIWIHISNKCSCGNRDKSKRAFVALLQNILISYLICFVLNPFQMSDIENHLNRKPGTTISWHISCKYQVSNCDSITITICGWTQKDLLILFSNLEGLWESRISLHSIYCEGSYGS